VTFIERDKNVHDAPDWLFNGAFLFNIASY
jgi:hypothetical protein